MLKLKPVLYVGILYIGLSVFGFINGSKANAAFLQQRTVKVATSVASANTTHTLSFNVTTTNIIGSVQFEYCENDPIVGSSCVAPIGLNSGSASLVSQTGETGFSISVNSTANKIILTRTPVPTTPGLAEFVLSGIINPSVMNRTTYVRMTTYTSTDASGTYVDGGGAAFSTSGNFGAAAYVPPVLSFCVAVTVSTNCSSYSGTLGTFGELSNVQTRSLTTEMAAGTNDPTGYRIYVIGNTMTSGNSIIEPLSTQFPSVAGINQFGINLRKNNNPSIGENVQGSGVGNVLSGYNTPDQYRFVSGEAVAEATSASDYNKYTVSYIVNVTPQTRAGVYVTTVSYMAIAQF